MKKRAIFALIFLRFATFVPMEAPVAASPPSMTLSAAGSDAACFSPDGKMLACRSDAGALSLWNVSDGKRVWSEPFGVYDHFAFSPDGKRLAFSEIEGKVYLRDTQPGGRRRSLPLSFANVSAIVFAPDSKTVTVSRHRSDPAEATLSFFTVSDGRLVRTWRRFTCENEEASLLTYSPNGRWLAMVLDQGGEGSFEARLVFFDLRTGRRVWQQGGLSVFDISHYPLFRFSATGGLFLCGQKYLDLRRRPWILHPLLPGFGERDFTIIAFYDPAESCVFVENYARSAREAREIRSGRLLWSKPALYNGITPDAPYRKLLDFHPATHRAAIGDARGDITVERF